MSDAGAQAQEALGERLRRLRIERGLSQRELSSKGVSYAYISRIEAGARQPSVKALRMLARKLNVAVEYLETGNELREIDARELRLSDAELKLRLENDPESVEQTLSELLDESIEAGDSVSETRARVALGFAAFGRGDNRVAVRRLEGAIASGLLPVRVRPDVYATLGRAYNALGADHQAVELFERCLEEVTEQSPDDLAAQVRFATYLSYALSDLGEFERAEAVIADALERSDSGVDPYTRVRLYWSLARLHNMDGQPAEALSYARRAIALLEATDDMLSLARAHLLSADIMIAQGRGTEAERQLRTAERLFVGHAEPVDKAMLNTFGSSAALLTGDLATAVRCARAALEVLGDSYETEQGRARAALGRALFASDDVEAGGVELERAIELLTASRQWREAAEVARDWGRALRKAGRESEALDVLERATSFAVRSQPAESRLD